MYVSLAHASNGENSILTGILGFIVAPELRCFGLYDITLCDPPIRELINYVDDAIKAYASLKKIHLEGPRRLIGTARLTPEVIQAWCRKGRQVNIRTGRGAWKTYGRQ